MLKIKTPFLSKRNLTLTIGICIVTILVSVPFFSFFNDGPYLKFLTKKEVYQGFIELFLMGFFIFVAISSPFPIVRKIFIPLAIAVIILSMRRHNVDIPLLIVFLYFNSFFFLGSFFKKEGFSISNQIPLSIAYGMIIFALFSLSLSVFNVAKDFILLIFSFLLSSVSFFHKERNVIGCFKWSQLKVEVTSSPFFYSLFAVVFIMLVFQANNAPGYDEFWYSLRSHELLNRNGSFFEKIIYPDNWVTYYPKLTEILIYPLSVIPNYVVSKLFSVFTWGLISLMIFSFLNNGNRKNALIFTLIIIVTPALGNMAIFTKGDVLALFFFIAAFLIMLKSIENFDSSSFLIAIGISLVSFSAKLTAMPYTIFFILFFAIIFLIKSRERRFSFRIKAAEWVLLAATVLLVFLVFYRTYSLVGVPFVQIDGSLPFIRSVYKFMGFQYNYCLHPFDLEMGAKVGFFKILFSSLFQPMNLKASVAWYSNFYFLLMISCFYFFMSKKSSLTLKIEHVFSFLLVGFFWILTGILMANKFYNGGDGNYYLVPVIVSSMVFAAFLVRQKIEKWWLIFVFISYFTLHLSLVFITGPNWDPGTDRFHHNFKQNPLTGLSNKNNYHKEAIEKLGIDDLIQYLPDDKSTFLGGIGKEMLAYKLGYSYLNLRNVEHARGYLFENYGAFLKLIKDSGINFLLLPVNHSSSLRYAAYFDKIKEEPGVLNCKGNTFYLLDLRALQAAH